MSSFNVEVQAIDHHTCNGFCKPPKRHADIGYVDQRMSFAELSSSLIALYHIAGYKILDLRPVLEAKVPDDIMERFVEYDTTCWVYLVTWVQP